jgi:hypothetical protein
MGNSVRIRTELGINKTLNVELEQNFNSLEILSLKIQQEDLYNQSCSQYGVVVGRVIANGGYGVPNARISVFIPITNEDKGNPEILAIYPYTSPEGRNEDGYRYNLLPYEQSYSNHVPTGTFPSRKDALTDRLAIEIYDKYYKYVVKTNESGDFMIMGVPLGVQTVFMDLDLSDMGEFSLTPQDLIRMGRATEAQIAGRQFKSSTDLNSLPQIVSITKSIDVSPLWGDPSTCQIAVSRVDFDLRDDVNIDIQPTSVFMGSMISSIENKPVRVTCKPATEMGNLCNLVAGPGEILAIRQTIYQDNYGRPILEQYNFDGGNDVIDTEGVWIADLPMNLDYVTINEFGERIISNDPKVGIPTKGKYRFKVKWKQPNDLSQSVKRGYYLVPNIRENGWGTNSSADPRLSTGAAYSQFIKSYAFSLDWDDYGDTGTTIGKKIIQSAIDCDDRFYEFNYNKVYTVSNLIDLYHKGWANGRFIGIKQITDTNCDSTNYKFPTNDGVKNFDFLFAITNFILTIYTITIIAFIPVLHIMTMIFPILKAIFVFQYFYLQYIIYGLCRVVKLIKWSTKCNEPKSIGDVWSTFPKNPFVNFSLPIITYPECEMCSCNQETISGENSDPLTAANTAAENNPVSCNISVANSVGYSNYNQQEYCNDDPFINGNSTSCNIITSACEDGVTVLQELMAGNNLSNYWKRTPATVFGTCNGIESQLHSQDLTLAERLNLFNTKGKYFDSLSSQGGGWNQIKVKIRPDLNPSPQKYHYDNVMVMMIDNSCADQFSTGKLISFNNPAESGDNNLTGYSETKYIDANGDEFTTTAAIGTPTSLSQINLTYANPTNPSAGVSVSYVVDQTTEIVNAEVPNTQGIITGFTYEGGGGILVDNTYNNVGGVSNTNGSGATFNITVSSGLITTVILNNAGIGYYEGDTISFFDTQFGGTDNEIVLVVNVSGVTPQQYTQNIIQKFPTDIEYFQVLTSMTYSQFCSLNPTVPTGQYNNNFTLNFDSLRYRYIDNFMTFFTEITNTTFIPLYGPINTFQYVSQYNTLRPIFAMPEQKDFLITFLVRGVDPHSARQTMEVDISRLMGQSYGNVKITGDYKLNIPIQPELRIPRHNLITTNQTITPQGGIFFDSFLYSTSSTFRSFNTNLISNYSSLDSTRLGYQVDNTTNTTLDTNKISITNGYVSVNNSTNAFGAGSYSLISNDSNLVNSAAYNSTNNPTHNLDLLSTGVKKQHRGYYNNEYVEGGTYFYMKPTEVQTINLPGLQILSVNRILPQSFIYFSPVYSSGITTQFLTGTKKIVMRTDRLPSSSYRDDLQNNNIFVLNQNQGFSVYSYDDVGSSNNQSLNITQGYSTGLSSPQDFESQFEQSVVSTFNCANLTPLGCYSGNGESFGVKPVGDSCYNKAPVKGGCYVFVSPPLFSLVRDMTTQIGEWKTRFRVNLGACRGVFGHSFNNNWINGTLFAFPIKNKRLFDSNNKPFNKYCKDIAMLHPTTNNFFYRSSPYNALTDKFIGMTPPNPTHRNKVQLLYPTTIMDLGPRDEFAYELTLSENYFGYVMDKFEQTTYQDVSDILNLFIISRQINAGFWEKIAGFGDASINGFFSRRGYLPLLPGRFDGDYAQSISINSEIGVDDFGFDSYSYSTGSTGNNSFYVNNNIFGIFFSSNTQTRDYLTPRRIIRNDLINPGIYDYLPIKSQMVPMYKWKIENSNTIFGTEKNEWATNQGDIQKFNYQSLDRINTVSNYFMGQTNIPEFFKGYIFNVKPATPPNTGYIFEGDRAAPMTNQSGSYTVGAPFYFYFGLVRGANAIDKFKKKYLGVEII